MAQTKIVIKIKPTNLKRTNLQLTFSEENLLQSSETAHKKEKEIIQRLLTIPPLPIELQGISYLDKILAPPYPTNTYSKHCYHPKNTSEKVYSILFPVMDPKTNHFIRIHVVRDNHREFTTDGNALLFTIKEHTYGVIYLDHPMFYSRIPVRAHVNDEFREILYNSVVPIFASIASDPMGYFSEMGRQCGLCMICGRGLTDEASKRVGYGPICARIFQFIRTS